MSRNACTLLIRTKRRCFEVVILLAGMQPDADVVVGAMGILFTTHSLSYMLCSGFGTAAATRVSNELGG